jgi:hypothetical protein
MENKISRISANPDFSGELKKGLFMDELEQIKLQQNKDDQRISELSEKLADIIFNLSDPANNPICPLESSVPECPAETCSRDIGILAIDPHRVCKPDSDKKAQSNNRKQGKSVKKKLSKVSKNNEYVPEQSGFFHFSPDEDWEFDTSKEINESLNDMTASFVSDNSYSNDIRKRAAEILNRTNCFRKTFEARGEEIKNQIDRSSHLIEDFSHDSQNRDAKFDSVNCLASITPEQRTIKHNLLRKNPYSKKKNKQPSIRDKIYDLKLQGLSDEKIARSLGITIGEVQLIQRVKCQDIE